MKGTVGGRVVEGDSGVEGGRGGGWGGSGMEGGGGTAPSPVLTHGPQNRFEARPNPAVSIDNK